MFIKIEQKKKNKKKIEKSFDQLKKKSYKYMVYHDII